MADEIPTASAAPLPQRSSGLNVLEAMIVAPVVVGFVFTFAIMAFGAVDGFPDLLGANGTLLIALAMSLVIAIVTWTLGLAWHALAIRIGWRGLVAYAAAGAALGALVLGLRLWMTVEYLSVDQGREYIPIASMLALGVVLGAATASLFWFLRRPDRDQADTPPNAGSA